MPDKNVTSKVDSINKGSKKTEVYLKGTTLIFVGNIGGRIFRNEKQDLVLDSLILDLVIYPHGSLETYIA